MFNILRRVGAWLFKRLRRSPEATKSSKWLNGFVLHQASKIAGKRYAEHWFMRKYLRTTLPATELLKPTRNFNVELKIDRLYTPLELRSSGLTDDSLIGRSGAILVTGAPGSGKTSLLQFLSRTLATQGLRSAPGTATLPCRLALKKLRMPPGVQDFTPESAFSLIEREFIKLYTSNSGIYRAEGCFRSMAENAGAAIYLDGFDEVAAPDRHLVANFCDNLAVALAAMNHRNLVVVTSRPQVVESHFDDAIWDVEELSEFSDKGVYSLLLRWPYRGSTASSAVLAGTIYEHLEANQALLDACKNPLALSLFVALVQREGFARADEVAVYPETRAEFYRQLTELLLARRRAEQRLQGGSLSALIRSRSAFLEEVAHTHLLSEEVFNSIPVDRLIAVANQLSLGGDEASASDAVDQLVVETGLLEKDGALRYRFISDALLAYFGGKVMAGSRYNRRIQFNCKLANQRPDRFEDALLFALGLLGMSSSGDLQNAYLTEIASATASLLPRACMEAQAYNGVGFSSSVRRELRRWETDPPSDGDVRSIARVLRDYERVCQTLGVAPKVQVTDVMNSLESCLSSRDDAIRMLAVADISSAVSLEHFGGFADADVEEIVRSASKATLPGLVAHALRPATEAQWAAILAEACLRYAQLAVELNSMELDDNTGRSQSRWSRCWACRGTMLGRVLDSALASSPDPTKFPHLALLSRTWRPSSSRFEDRTRSGLRRGLSGLGPLILLVIAVAAVAVAVGVSSIWTGSGIALASVALIARVVRRSSPSLNRALNLDPVQMARGLTVFSWHASPPTRAWWFRYPRPVAGDQVVAYQRGLALWRKVASGRLFISSIGDMQQWATPDLRSWAHGNIRAED